MITTQIGTVTFNPRGVQFWGVPSTAITLDIEDTRGVIDLGITWHLRSRLSTGAWEQFYVSDPCYSTSQRQAFCDAVNGKGMRQFLIAVAGTINAQIAARFGEYVGAGIPLPPKPAPTPLTPQNTVENLSLAMANDFKFFSSGSGVPVLVVK